MWRFVSAAISCILLSCGSNRAMEPGGTHSTATTTDSSDIAGAVKGQNRKPVPFAIDGDSDAAAISYLDLIRTEELTSKQIAQIDAFKQAIQSIEKSGSTPSHDGKNVVVASVTIIGGEDDDSDPAVGCLLLTGKVHCTATVIGPRTLLTAAHCADGYVTSQLGFITGSRASSTTAHRYRIKSKLIHEKYVKNDVGINDIALLYLDETFKEGASVPLPDTKPDLHLADQAALRFVGFGYTFVTPDGDKWGIGKKMKVNMRIRDITETTFSYGDSQYNTCNGDSGGPALMSSGSDEVVEGVTSWGDKPCRKYGIDMRIDTYVPWIRQHMERP